MMLNSKQLEAFNLIKNKENILLTGSAGTGKSFTLLNIVKYLNDSKINYGLTAMTGCAAILINGQTLHSFLGIGLGNESIDIILFKIKRRYPGVYTKLKKLETLIIDEISMMNSNLFELISDLFINIKNNEKPFGGLQLVLVGDFCQLPPINGDYCFTSKIWNEIEIHKVMLTELIRQKDDKLFQQILQIVRKGKCPPNVFKILSSLSETKFENDIEPTKLYPINVDVNKINEDEFNKLCDKSNNNYKIYNAVSNDKYIKLDNYSVKLIKNAQVMITRNINIFEGLVNGTRGVICDLYDESILIKDINGNMHIIEYVKNIIDNDKGIYISYLPIKLAYALSIHKSQGMTIDALEIDLGLNIFAPGQLYTALSRAKSLKLIRIIDIHKDSFKINSKVKKFYEL